MWFDEIYFFIIAFIRLIFASKQSPAFHLVARAPPMLPRTFRGIHYTDLVSVCRCFRHLTICLKHLSVI